MASLFVNPEERRPRAGWRLLIQFLLFMLVTIGGQAVLGIGLGIYGALAGENVADPAFLAAMMSSPLMRIVSGVISMIAILVSYLVASRWLDRRPLRDFGFHFNRNWWLDFGFGLFLGAILMVFIFLVERAVGWIEVTGTLQSQVPGVSFWTGILAWVLVFTFVGIYEEMLSRGYQLRNLAEGLNFKAVSPRTALLLAYLISSSFFGLLHASNPNATVISTVNLIVAGLFLGFGYVLTGELAIPIGLHMTWNFFQGNVFGFPVSGMNTPATIIAIQQGGPELWTGGPFGPEAGLIGLVAIAIGMVLTALWVKVRYGRAVLQERLAVYPTQTPPLVSNAGQADIEPSTAPGN